MSRNIIVFDLDGTLLDTLEDLTNATNAALYYSGFPTYSTEEIRSFVGNGVKNLIKKAVPENCSEEDFDTTFGYFKDYYGMHCKDKTKPYDGVLELMAKMKEKGYQMAIVSNKLDSAVKELNDQFFCEFVTVTVGDQEGLNRKPHPDMVEEALRRMGEDKESAVYIGDSEVDLQTAVNSGLPCISVLWGFRNQDELEEAGATIFANTPDEVLELLAQMN